MGAGGSKEDAADDDDEAEAEEERDPWTPSDVYSDLAALELAITLHDPYTRYESAEREERLNYMAQEGQPPLVPFLCRYLLFPLVLAWPLSALTRPAANRQVGDNIVTLLARNFVRLWDWHFWTVVVGTPILAWTWKSYISSRPRRRKGIFPPEPSLSPSRIRAARCDDFAFSLLEYWKSAVIGITVFPLSGLLNRASGREIFLRRSPFLAFWWPTMQLLTRMAAAASLFQYRDQLYRLQCPTQPRPVAFFPTVMQALVRCMLTVLPWGVASDLSRILVTLPRSSIIAMYSCISLALVGTWVRMKRLRQNIPPLQCVVLPLPSRKIRLAYGSLSLALIWWKQLACWSTKVFRFLNHGPAVFYDRVYDELARLLSVQSMMLFRILLWTRPAVRPLFHLVAATKIISIAYVHDLPLTMTPETYEAALDDEYDMQRRTKWRLRMEWRTNRSLADSVDVLADESFYWWFLEGQPDDKIDKKYEEGRPRGISRLVNRMQADIVSDMKKGVRRPSNRDEWKERAMSDIAKKHQADYDRNGAVGADDPLGVAIQQTFGIGLSFAFDHTSPLKKGQEPSPRRLQARAAKSAIRRVQELYDAEREYEKEPNNLSDDERERRRGEIEAEILHLAKRLSELIPLGRSYDVPEVDLKRFEMKTMMFRKGSHPNEYIAYYPDTQERGSTNIDYDDTDFIDLLADTRTLPPLPVSLKEARTQPKAPEEESRLAKKYQSLPLADRAFAILVDLGMIDEPTNTVTRRMPSNAETEAPIEASAEALLKGSEKRHDDDDDDDWEPTIVYV